jgi:hypothetical protein
MFSVSLRSRTGTGGMYPQLLHRNKDNFSHRYAFLFLYSFLLEGFFLLRTSLTMCVSSEVAGVSLRKPA